MFQILLIRLSLFSNKLQRAARTAIGSQLPSFSDPALSGSVINQSKLLYVAVYNTSPLIITILVSYVSKKSVVDYRTLLRHARLISTIHFVGSCFITVINIGASE